MEMMRTKKEPDVARDAYQNEKTGVAESDLRYINHATYALP